VSPTQRSLKYLRDQGYTVAIVEHYNCFTKRRHDLFQFADLLAIRENEVMLVQVTSGTNVSARVKKISESEHIAAVRKSGMRVEVHGWRKLKSGWAPKIVDLS
jgi:carbonic anhydrase